MSKVQQYFEEDEFLSDNDDNNIDNDIIDDDVEEFIEIKSKKLKKNNNDNNIDNNITNNININLKKETKESPYITEIIKIGEDLFLDDYKNKKIIIFCFSCNDNKKITNIKVMKTIIHYKLGGIIYNIAGDCSKCGTKIYKNLNFERDNIKNKIPNLNKEIYDNIYYNINNSIDNSLENSLENSIE